MTVYKFVASSNTCTQAISSGAELEPGWWSWLDPEVRDEGSVAPTRPWLQYPSFQLPFSSSAPQYGIPHLTKLAFHYLCRHYDILFLLITHPRPEHQNACEHSMTPQQFIQKLLGSSPNSGPIAFQVDTTIHTHALL
ncbi:UNVERIFIED_CONTAM: hypothetical protein K2H54_066020 [Gekko kuhli]